MPRYRDFDATMFWVRREAFREGDITVPRVEIHDLVGISNAENLEGDWVSEWSIKNAVDPSLPAYSFAIKKDSVIIGAVTVWNVDEKDGVAYLSYWLSKKYAGAGLGTKCVSAVMKYAFEVLGVFTLVSPVNFRNAISIRVAEKLGMLQAGSAKLENLDGVFEDHWMYRKIY